MYSFSPGKGENQWLSVPKPQDVIWLVVLPWITMESIACYGDTAVLHHQTRIKYPPLSGFCMKF